MAGNNLKREIVITANGKGAESVLTVLKKHMKDLHDQMAQLEQDGKANTKEYRELQTTYKQLNQQTKQQTFEFERYDKVMRNLSSSSVRQLRQALKALKKEMELYSSDDPQLDILRNKIKAVQDQINEATGTVKEHGNSWQDALKGMLAFAAGFEVLDTLKDKLQQVIEKTFEFGDAQANVKKVTGLNDKGIADLSNRLAKLDTRTTLTDLQNLAYEGGKLGIGQYGVQGLESYVRAANQIKVALGDDLGEDAMLPLAKMGEVMGLFNGTAESVEKGILQIGSAINELTQSSSSSGSAIVDFGQRVQGMAAYLKLSTADMLALGSAADAAGLSMETSGTAFSMFLSALQKSPGAIEKALNIEDGTINQLVNSGKTMDAILLILDKMKEAGNMHNLEDAFKALGSEGARMVGVLATMSQKVDMVREHVDVSRTAFKEATSVTNEYNVQNETAAAIMERANNMWNNLFVNTDGVDNVKGMAQSWYDLSKAITTNSVVMASAKMTFQMLRLAIQGIIALLPILLTLLMTNGLMKAFSVLGPMVVSFGRTFVANFTLIRAALEGSTIAAGRLTIAWRTMTLAMKANVIMLAVSVVAELAYAIYNLTQKTDEAHNAVVDFSKDVADAGLQSAAAEAKVKRFADQIERAGKNEKERNRAIAAFNKQFGQYMSHLLTEKSTAKDVADAYAEVVKNMRAKALLEAKQKGQKVVDQKYVESRNRSNRFEELTKGTRNEVYDRDWLENYIADARKAGKTAEQVSKEIGRQLGNMYGWEIDNIWERHRGDTNLDKVFVGKSAFKRKATVEEKQLHAAIRTVLQSYAAENAQRKLDYTYKGIDTTVGGPEAEEPDEITNIETDAERKKRIAYERRAAAAARREQNDQMREWRDQLKQKQDQANAFFENIDNYYNRQINAKMKEAVDMGLDESEQKLFIEPLRKKRNDVMEQAYLAVAGQRNTLNDLIKDMGLDLMEVTDETGVNLSESLLSAIEGTDVAKLRADMIALAKKVGKPMQDVMADVFAKAAKSAQANLKLETQQQEARRKAIQEHDYTGVVQQSAYDDFNLLGYANPTDAEIKDKAAFDKRKANIIAMFEKARKEITTVFAADVSTEEGRGLLMKTLFGDDPDGMGKRIAEVLGNDAKEWQAFYQKLIQYNDEYIAAEKKRYDDAKKNTDFLWKRNERNLAQQDKLRKMENESQMFGKRTNLLSNLGLANLTADPEIELMKARMQAAEDYYAFVERNTKNKQLIDEAERARQEAELAYANQMATAMKSRLSQMKELVQPIEDFGAAVGQALAEMRYDAESANDAIKSALKSMLESWTKMALNDVNTQMWKAINDAGAKQGKANAQPDIEAARANAKANAVTLDTSDIGTAGNPAHVIVDNGISVDSNGNPSTTEPPRAWQKRNPGKTIDDYNNEVNNFGGQVGSSMAGQAGAAVADAVTGNSGLGEAAAGIAIGGVNAAMNADLGKGGANKKEDKQRKKQLQEEKKHQKNLTKEVKKGISDREKATDKGVKNMSATTDQGNNEQSKGTELAQQTMVNATDAALNATLTAKQKNNDETLKSDAARTEGEVTFSIAGAMAKCFEFLGPIAGPIAAAVVMSTLMGLLQWALSSALGGGKKKNSSKGPNTKVVSGMLTYDSGNVQDLRPFVGDDGSLYWATEDNKPHNGVSLITQPTATTINGQRALVAENGPELVIGRETTRAIMMNPQLMKALVNYDRNYSGRRAYDTGNVAESSATIASGTPTPNDVGVSQADTNLALLQAIGTLMQRLNEPIEARIDMYGRGNLYDSMTKASRFMKRK